MLSRSEEHITAAGEEVKLSCGADVKSLSFKLVDFKKYFYFIFIMLSVIERNV